MNDVFLKEAIRPRNVNTYKDLGRGLLCFGDRGRAGRNGDGMRCTGPNRFPAFSARNVKPSSCNSRLSCLYHLPTTVREDFDLARLFGQTIILPFASFQFQWMQILVSPAVWRTEWTLTVLNFICTTHTIDFFISISPNIVFS